MPALSPWLDQEGGLHLKYINAKTLLPEALVEELQNYIQAGYIYVPAKEEQHRSWWEVSGYRKELEKRNKTIRTEYRKGFSMEELALRYCLSTSAVRKIIYHKWNGPPQEKHQNAAVFLYKTLRCHSVDCERTAPPGKISLSCRPSEADKLISISPVFYCGKSFP
mgnify:CR=1 FL=1